MSVRAAEVRVTDSKARLTLPKSFASSTLLIEQVSDVELVIRKATVVPLSADDDPLADRRPGPFSAADWKVFADALDNPPKLSKKMKDALAAERKKIRAEKTKGKE